MSTATTDCFACGTTVEGDSIEQFEEAFLVHIRAEHPDLPYPDNAVRNFAAATQRLVEAADRVAEDFAVEIHPVDESRLDDWLEFFDHRGFAGNPAWASCYCLEPMLEPASDDDDDPRWYERRQAMMTMLGSGAAFGYLAYADGEVAGWVNASLRSDAGLYRQGEGADPPDAAVAVVSCFVIAPPYRRHGLAARLLDRVIADAPGRGAGFVEAYPFKPREDDHTVSADAGEFRGPRHLFDERGFVVVGERDRDVVVRLSV